MLIMQIVSRAEWGARPPKSVQRTTWATRIGVAVHYSDGPPTQTPRQLQNYAMDSLGYSDTHYNFFVDQAGTVFEGRGWLVVGGHALGQNTPWVGICFIGRNADVTAAAEKSIREFVAEAERLAGKTMLVSGHGQLPDQNTDCPGETLRAWIAAGMPVGEGDDVSEYTGVHLWVAENRVDAIANLHDTYQGGWDQEIGKPVPHTALLKQIAADVAKLSVPEIDYERLADLVAARLAAQLSLVGKELIITAKVTHAL